jgi:hypothetical protein
MVVGIERNGKGYWIGTDLILQKDILWVVGDKENEQIL